MNRIQLPVWTAQNKPASLATTSAASSLGGGGRPATCYHLFTPLHYEPNYAYPLLIWMHGPQDHERQLQRIMPLVSLRNYVAIGPRGTCRHHDDQPGYHWGSGDSAVGAAENAVLDALDAARQRFNINEQRVFLAGYGCGGTMAFRVGLRHADLFAGVLSIGGPFPSGRGVLPTMGTNLRRLPLFIAHGRDAREYSVERLCNDLRLFHVAGLGVTVRQYPCGDELTTKMLSDMNTWIMERVTGQKQEPTPSPFASGEWN
ncbi:MAG TPA: PHB depolymerase family esterase [Pirellulaceae bacterium]|nr:PHB depolymerase family esterase [Pirellulaceae bacterium]